MADASVPFPWHQQLPRLGAPEEFAALSRLLEESCYSEKSICARLGLERLNEDASLSSNPSSARPAADALDVLIQLFFCAGFVEETAAASVLPSGALLLFDSLRLLDRDAAHAGKLFASSVILPAAGRLTVCDRGPTGPDGSVSELPPDVVYPAIFETTRRFLAGLPVSPCEAVLDLCTGTGIAALVAAGQSGHVWATDIAERAARYSEFNRRLAALSNVTVLTGDLYTPVDGLTFDRIIIHPPYVPARQSRIIFRDGGEDGEQIIRRTVEGLPRFLRPGGRFYSLLMASDRDGETFERRLRTWLGPEEDQFDIAVGAHSARSPEEYFVEVLLLRGANQEGVEFLETMWSNTHTTAILYASLVIERHAHSRAARTIRVPLPEGLTASHLESILDASSAAAVRASS